MNKLLGVLSLSVVTITTWAAIPTDAKDALPLLLQPNPQLNHSTVAIEQTEFDFNHRQHIRLKQKYKGFPVIRGDAIIHLKNSKEPINDLNTISQLPRNDVSINGIIYKDIDKDLAHSAELVFSTEQKEKALNYVISLQQEHNHPQAAISHQSAELMVYVDEEHKAHWVYWIKFYIHSSPLPKLPALIIDAQTLAIYHQWSELERLSDVVGGGYGGNETKGMVTYDGAAGHLPAFHLVRDDQLALCYMSNDEVTIKTMQDNNEVVHYPCTAPNPSHNKVFWNDYLSMANGGYSPANDAFYAATMARKMFIDWYHVPPVVQYGKPISSTVLIHLPANNAYWDPVSLSISIGDGNDANHPLSTLDIIAHEMAHGFTIQHSHIVSMDSQSGAIVESFSDITAQAVQWYVRGTNDWMIGHDNTKNSNPNAALRYLDNPPRDGRSIDHWDKYNNRLSPHLLAGIFNKAFYVLATSPGWDVRKAYDVWIQANRYYWLPLPTMTSFASAAYCILSASEDFSYDKKAIRNAFAQVGIDTSQCG